MNEPNTCERVAEIISKGCVIECPQDHETRDCEGCLADKILSLIEVEITDMPRTPYMNKCCQEAREAAIQAMKERLK